MGTSSSSSSSNCGGGEVVGVGGSSSGFKGMSAAMAEENKMKDTACTRLQIMQEQEWSGWTGR
jgi:hypothetical protein